MIPLIREQYNRAFTLEKYDAFLREINGAHPGNLGFRIAETPVFIPAAFKHRLIQAGKEVLGILNDPDFPKKTRAAIPSGLLVPGETDRPEFIVVDFAVCTDENGAYVPRLIELQGFPSINAFQPLLATSYRNYFSIPDGFSPYLSGYDENSYWDLLKELIVGGHDPREVILLEIEPENQKTRLDFYLTQDKLGVEPLCLTELEKDGKKLFYRKGKEKIRVRRIYNRLIFDDLKSRKRKVRRPVDITHRFNVEWVSHPNWFYRVSKYLLPLLDSSCVPPAYFLNKLEVVPADLEHYVLKPLFSFAGQGVMLNVRKEKLDKVKDPQNWILQRKVNYAPVIRTPDDPAKCEIRLMYYWKKGDKEPILALNLCRLSKTHLSGIRYNEKKSWVGVGICFFEQD